MAENNFLNSRDEQLVRKLIAEAAAAASIGQRIELLSARFLGARYLLKPLAGSPTVPEQFIVRFDGFDCVTYVETVLALARARRVEDFLAWLRRIRYENGQVEWQRRLHYTSDWAREQARRGWLRDMTVGEGTVKVERTLSFVAGLKPKTIEFRYFPKPEFGYVSRWLTDGDLIYFVSTRRNLDTFHIGLVIRDGERLLIRHARHMRGRVFEQPLAEFMQVIKSPGFIINRPVAE